METMQPWATGFNRPKPLPTQMSIQRSQSSPLSREICSYNFVFASDFMETSGNGI